MNVLFRFLSYTKHIFLFLFILCLVGCTSSTPYVDVATNKGFEDTIHQASSSTPSGHRTKENADDDKTDSKAEATPTETFSTEESTTAKIIPTEENITTETVSTEETTTTESSYTAELPVEDLAIPSANTETAIPKEHIKIGILYPTTPAEYIGYTYLHDLGVQKMQSQLELSDSQILRKLYITETDTTAIQKAIQECINDGCNIIFCTSRGYSKIAASMAAQYPDIYFAIENSSMPSTGNQISYSGLLYQVDYLSGILAAKKTQSGRIGMVAQMDINDAAETSAINAFAMGVYSVNPNANIYVRITTSRLAPQSEEQCAKDLAYIGCDVIAQHCYTAKPQLTASINGIWGIGYGTDMGTDTPNTTLCSILWDWSVAYTHIVTSVIAGTWDGTNYYGGLADGLTDITNLSTQLNSNETITYIDTVKEQIKTGNLLIYNGKFETNTGSIVKLNNTIPNYESILNNTNWYFKNIKILRSNGEITDGTELLTIRQE